MEYLFLILRAFDEDIALTEMPIALDTLTSAEVEYIQQAALEMGLHIRKLNQVEKLVRVF